MRNANVRILLIALVLVAAVGAAGFLMARTGGDAGEDAVRGYLRVQVDSEARPLIPLTEGGTHVIEQEDGSKNVIHTTADGALMAFSTCHNQNCVQQGEVTLANRQSRALGSLIVCLPNKVLVELLTPEEAGAEP